MSGNNTTSSFSTTRILVECAVLIAMGTVLDQIKLFRMPLGGSVTLCALVPFVIIALRHGTKWGVISGIANVILQIALGGIYPTPAGTAIAMVGEVVFDYLIAYGCFGLAYVFAKPFKNKAGGAAFAMVMCCLIRFLSAFISGVIIWGSISEGVWPAVTYSLSYNAGYMIPVTILNTAAIYLLAKKTPQIFNMK